MLILEAVDADLTERWRKRQKPFDGVTLVLPRLVRLDRLRADIRVVIAELRPQAGGSIQTLEDWHEHDGYIEPGRLVEWRSLADSLDSDEAFFTPVAGGYIRSSRIHARGSGLVPENRV